VSPAPAGRSCIAAGHPATVAAAREALDAGGNAVDAVVAAGFASAVAEPTLTGLAGGGFLLARTPGGEEVLFDFFVDTPGLGSPEPSSPEALDFEAVTVRFRGAVQDFHVGLGSVAVPGCLAGYLHAHRRIGRLELGQVVAPARRLAGDGVPLNRQQAHLLHLLAPILERTPAAAAIFTPGGRIPDVGDRLVNPDLEAFLARLDERGFAAPEIVEGVTAAMAGHGLLTATDLSGYRVVERQPLEVEWRGHRLLTNPPPAFGGELVALGLALLEQRADAARGPFGTASHAVALATSMIRADQVRASGAVREELVRWRSTGGTTHVSVADAEGGVAAMTTSNGEGSGWIIPGTGVMANNMLGEDDLHPTGFHAAPPGHRVASMMAPSIVVAPDGGVELVAGSGGSKRIRTALTQVVSAVVDHRLPLERAVEAPRLHWDGERIQAEPGWPREALDALRARWEVNEWDERDLYFGGVHAVVPGRAAAGDPRRGGSSMVTTPGP
jgi:gamma-glutamyltranspeptidase / glutathione hydrolase